MCLSSRSGRIAKRGEGHGKRLRTFELQDVKSGVVVGEVHHALRIDDRVRVLAHRGDDRSKRLEELGAEVVYGDLLDFDAMRAALSGVQRAYFCYPIHPGIVQATAQFAQAAKEAGVEFIVNM